MFETNKNNIDGPFSILGPFGGGASAVGGGTNTDEQGIDDVLSQAEALTDNRTITGAGHRLSALNLDRFTVTTTGLLSFTGSAGVTYVANAVGHVFNGQAADVYAFRLDGEDHLRINVAQGFRMNNPNSIYTFGDASGTNIPPLVGNQANVVGLMLDADTGRILRGTAEVPFAPTVADATAVDPETTAFAWQTSPAGGGVGLYVSVGAAGSRVMTKA